MCVSMQSPSLPLQQPPSTAQSHPSAPSATTHQSAAAMGPQQEGGRCWCKRSDQQQPRSAIRVPSWRQVLGAVAMALDGQPTNPTSLTDTEGSSRGGKADGVSSSSETGTHHVRSHRRRPAQQSQHWRSLQPAVPVRSSASSSGASLRRGLSLRSMDVVPPGLSDGLLLGESSDPATPDYMSG